jgi:hypothetical protein
MIRLSEKCITTLAELEAVLGRLSALIDEEAAVNPIKGTGEDGTRPAPAIPALSHLSNIVDASRQSLAPLFRAERINRALIEIDEGHQITDEQLEDLYSACAYKPERLGLNPTRLDVAIRFAEDRLRGA